MNPALAAFSIVARINRVDVDIRSIMREHGINGQVSPEELLRIAKRSEFKAKLKNMQIKTLLKSYPLPAILVGRANTYTVLLKGSEDGSKALCFDPEKQRTVEKNIEEMESDTQSVLVLRHKKITTRAAFGFKWFFHEIMKFKRIMGQVLLGSFVVQLFGLVTPLFTQVILDKVLVHRSLTTLDVLAIAFLAVTVFELLLNITRNYIFIHTANKLDAKLGSRLFNHLLKLPFMYFEARKVGNIATRVKELDTIREFLTNKAVSVIIDLLFSVVFVAVMLLYSIKLTFVVLGFVTLIALLYLIITPELRRRLEQKFQMSAASQSYLVESVTGVQTVKSLALEGSMQQRWENHLGRYVRSSFRLANMSNISSALSGTARRLMTIAILYIGVRSVLKNELTIGQLIAFQMFAGQFAGPVLRLVNLWNEFQQALLSVDRLGDILNHPLEAASDKLITLPKLKGDIRFENVSFQYSPSGAMAVDGVSFHIRPGISVGIVGRSGSGKSTLAKLLQRLYIPTAGAVFVDGIDVRHLSPHWLRHNIGVVLQDNYLFSGTVRENIALARPESPMEQILQASHLAGAHEFIAQLPEGYDTEVSERGASLSGGQKQRIAIARALLTNPRILIFDEATSALDYHSEKIIRENLKMIKKGRTSIIIAHRLSTIKECDMILVLDKGRIVESGSHEKLLERQAHYHDLALQQA